MSEQKTKPALDPLGGQAVIEGVMMRSTRAWALAVRRPDETIDIRTFANGATKGKGVWGWPVLRGIRALGSSLKVGATAMQLSALAATGTPLAGVGVASNALADDPSPQISEEQVKRTVRLALLLSLPISIGVFFVLPALAASAARPYTNSSILLVLLEKAIRMSMFIGYLLIIGRTKQINSIFRYHGAEHKAIACYEQGRALEPAEAAKCSRFHPRCGTSFILIVMLISVFIFALIGRPPLWELALSRVIAIPLVAGIAFEALRLMARYQDHLLARAAIAPGLWLQRLTTREPDARELEVALAALKATL